MFIVTFYSYKGGSGRTSALMNAVYRLLRAGKRVFIIDFDLEAPGIDSYGLVSKNITAPGLVEYLFAFMTSGAVPQLGEFVFETTVPGFRGKLFVMRGGKKDESYKTSLAALDWKVLYRQRKGFFLMENLKAAINELYSPDYLLIDARTGLTDISGICTLQLPHLVVLFFSLNEQSIEGVSSVLQSIKNNKLNREIKTLLVASPVPAMPEWVEARSARFELARKAMGRPVDGVIPYDPLLAFGETIIDGRQNEKVTSQLGRAYDSLTDEIIKANPADIITLLTNAEQLAKEGQHELAESHYRAIVDAMPTRHEAWLAFGNFEKLRRRPQQACEYFENAYSLDPSNIEVLVQLATTFAVVDEKKCAFYYQQYLECDKEHTRIDRVSTILANAGLAQLSIAGFSKATLLNNEDSSAFTSLGEVEMRLGHYPEAQAAYCRALELDPNSLICAFNAGFASQRLNNPSAIEYYKKAIDIFEQTKRPTDKVTLANSFEAMSRAYLAVGKSMRGFQLLVESIAVAKEIPNARIFTSAKYEWITQTDFIEEVSLRLQETRDSMATKQLGE